MSSDKIKGTDVLSSFKKNEIRMARDEKQEGRHQSGILLGWVICHSFDEGETNEHKKHLANFKGSLYEDAGKMTGNWYCMPEQAAMTTS